VRRGCHLIKGDAGPLGTGQMKSRLRYFIALLIAGLFFVGTGCSFNGRSECHPEKPTALTLDQSFAIALKTFQRDTQAVLEIQVIMIKRNMESRCWTFSFDAQPSGPGSEYNVFVFDDGTTKVLPGM
jgi:hypothetical protein